MPETFRTYSYNEPITAPAFVFENNSKTIASFTNAGQLHVPSLCIGDDCREAWPAQSTAVVGWTSENTGEAIAGASVLGVVVVVAWVLIRLFAGGARRI